MSEADRVTLSLRHEDSAEDYLILEGPPGLSWSNGPHGDGMTKTRGFDRVKLRVGADRWLVLDATPVPGFGAWPNNHGGNPESLFRGVSPEARVNAASHLLAGGTAQRKRLKSGASIYLLFHWANPLTPAGAGLYFVLRITARLDRLDFEGTQSKAFFAKKRDLADPDWTTAGVFVDGPKSFEAFFSSPFDYGAAGGLDEVSGLLTAEAGPTAWAVHLLDAEEGAYRLAAVTARPRDQQLTATLYLDEDNTQESPVSARACAGAADLPQHSSFAARTVELRCAKASKLDNRWILDWANVDGARPPAFKDKLCLPVLWRYMAEHFALGLAAAQARNRFTVTPTEIEKTGGPVLVRFEVTTNREGQPLETLLRQVSLQGQSTLKIALGGAETAGGARPVLTVRAKDAFHDPEGPFDGSFLDLLSAANAKQPFADAVLRFSGPAAAPATPQVDWVLGGVRVAAATFKTASVRFTLQDAGDLIGRRPLGCDTTLEFAEASYAAASQDPEVGFETLAGWLPRPRPVSIDLLDPSATLSLAVTETADRERSRTLRLQLRPSAAVAQTLVSDVVVLDPAPLTVARVRDEIALDDVKGLIAEYTDDSEGSAGWEFYAPLGDMSLVLPPQVVGEEMVKGRLTDPHSGKETPIAGEPFQHRLGANAHLRLDRTDIDTARAPPPWMLRRLMGRRTGVTGLKLRSAAFELVYGLTTEVAASGLRVAELDALIGRIPYADALIEFVRRNRISGAADEHRRDYALAQADWIADLLRRPSWWPLFRDVGERGLLTLTEGVDVSLRDGRQSAHPFAIDQFAAHGEPHTGRPLRGGVDWLFQSPNVYEAFRRKPTSTRALIEGVAFGPLGAEGSQSASFDNGRTIVISRTKQGRLDSLVLMRVGRIAMLHNQARHVIVYQRTSRRAPRYATAGGPGPDTYDAQRPGLEGFMAMRKVREYVEITQPRRALDHAPLGIPTAGPLGQSTFETTIIPVKASWGHDIDGGQVIALRGPMLPEEARFFPFPKAFLELHRSADKGGGLIANQFASPEQLYFLTSTRPQDTDDTDAWPAFPPYDASYIDAAPPPPLAYRTSFAGARRQPNARRSEFGQGLNTLDLIPAEEGANLMHGRDAADLDARFSAVSLRRALPPLNVPPQSLLTQLQRPVAEAEAYLFDKLVELQEQATAHARRVTDPGSAEHRRFLKDAAALRAELTRAAKSLKKGFTENSGQLQRLAGDWSARQQTLNEAYRKNASRELVALGERLADVSFDAGDPDAAKLKAQREVEAAVLQARRRVEMASFVPGQALARLTEQARELERRVPAVLAAARDNFIKAIADAAAAHRQSPERADELDATWRGAAHDALRSVAVLLESLQSEIVEGLGDLFGEGSDEASAASRLAEAVREVVAPRLERIGAAIDETPPFQFGAPDWGAIAALADRLQLAPKWLDTIREDFLAKLQEPPYSTWRAAVEQASKEIQAEAQDVLDDILAAGGVNDLETAMKDAAGKFSGWASAKVEDVAAGLDGAVAAVEGAWGGLQGEFNAAKRFADDVDARLKAIDDAFDAASVEEIGAQLQLAARGLQDQLSAAVQHAERAIVSDIKERLEDVGRDLLAEGSASALELTRALASGINTDTLTCTREQLGYYYEQGRQLLQVTRSSALLNELGEGALNALQAQVPFESIRDRLLPELNGIKLTDVLPKLCGIDLTYMFPELQALKDELGKHEWLSVKHGFDKERLTAWSDTRVDKQFEEDAALFTLGPISVALERARLMARMAMELGQGGARKQDVWASIHADWKIVLSGKALVTIRDGELLFGNDGRFDFKFDSEKIELAPEMKFITDAMAQLLPQEEGLTITPVLPAGITATLSLPLPDLGTGAFTLTGVTLHTHFGLLIAGGFEIQTGFWLSKPERPFGLAIVFLGGGGWVGVDVIYRPPSEFTTVVSIGISAGAFIALNLGFARASAGLLFTAGVDFRQVSGGGGGSTAISLGLLIWGEFSILSIASAYLRIVARITYTNQGGMIATGIVSVSIRISFFYTLSVRRQFQRVFSGGSSSRSAADTPAALALALDVVAAARPAPREAIAAHFLTLDRG